MLVWVGNAFEEPNWMISALTILFIYKWKGCEMFTGRKYSTCIYVPVTLCQTGQLKIFLKAVHSQLRAEGVIYSHSEERFTEDAISSQIDPALLNQLCSRVQLWPAMEYIGLLWQYKLTADYVAKACARR